MSSASNRARTSDTGRARNTTTSSASRTSTTSVTVNWSGTQPGLLDEATTLTGAKEEGTIELGGITMRLNELFSFFLFVCHLGGDIACTYDCIIVVLTSYVFWYLQWLLPLKMTFHLCLAFHGVCVCVCVCVRCDGTCVILTACRRAQGDRDSISLCGVSGEREMSDRREAEGVQDGEGHLTVRRRRAHTLTDGNRMTG